MKDLAVIIPCYNENHGIIKGLRDKLAAKGAEVIIVDDGSDKPPPHSIKHGRNKGYGQALMTGITHASRPVIMTVDGDGQHAFKDIVNLYRAWRMIDCDMLIGARRLNKESALRIVGRKALNTVASVLALRWLTDLNSGLRVFRRDKAIGYFPILCKEFSFTTSLTMSMLCDNYVVEWFPFKAKHRTFGNSRVRLVRHGCITLYYILLIGLALRTRGLRAWLRQLRQ